MSAAWAWSQRWKLCKIWMENTAKLRAADCWDCIVCIECIVWPQTLCSFAEFGLVWPLKPSQTKQTFCVDEPQPGTVHGDAKTLQKQAWYLGWNSGVFKWLKWWMVKIKEPGPLWRAQALQGLLGNSMGLCRKMGAPTWQFMIQDPLEREWQWYFNGNSMPSCKRLISHWIFLRYFQHTDILYPIDNCELDQGQVLNYADCGTPAGTTLIWTREKWMGVQR